MKELTAADLRIGNWIENNYGRKYQVTAAVLLEFQNFGFKDKPIPLTEEWLERFGFEVVVKKGNQSDYKVYQLNKITYNTLHGFYFNHQLHIPIQPKYVHTLQNLFFALCGEELTLKTQ